MEIVMKCLGTVVSFIQFLTYTVEPTSSPVCNVEKL